MIAHPAVKSTVKAGLAGEKNWQPSHVGVSYDLVQHYIHSMTNRALDSSPVKPPPLDDRYIPTSLMNGEGFAHGNRKKTKFGKGDPVRIFVNTYCSAAARFLRSGFAGDVQFG